MCFNVLKEFIRLKGQQTSKSFNVAIKFTFKSFVFVIRHEAAEINTYKSILWAWKTTNKSYRKCIKLIKVLQVSYILPSFL